MHDRMQEPKKPVIGEFPNEAPPQDTKSVRYTSPATKLQVPGAADPNEHNRKTYLEE